MVMQIADWLQSQPVEVAGIGSSYVTILSKDRGLTAASESSPAVALCIIALKYVGVPIS